MNPPDFVLLNLIKEGDVRAFENLFDANYRSLIFLARKIVGDLDKAKDIVQAVFVAIYENRANLTINSSIKSYLYKSVYNACLNHIKQTNIHNHHHDQLKNQLSESDDTDFMVQAELEERIRVIVENLPSQCGAIFRMNRFQGMKNREIAEKLNISIRTVETQISKALKILRDNLADFLTVLLLTILFL